MLLPALPPQPERWADPAGRSPLDGSQRRASARPAQRQRGGVVGAGAAAGRQAPGAPTLAPSSGHGGGGVAPLAVTLVTDRPWAGVGGWVWGGLSPPGGAWTGDAALNHLMSAQRKIPWCFMTKSRQLAQCKSTLV
jgi:hypothetical protein